jgi:hypothetical protein
VVSVPNRSFSQQEAEKKKEKAILIGKDLEVKQVEIEASKGEACTKARRRGL